MKNVIIFFTKFNYFRKIVPVIVVIILLGFVFFFNKIKADELIYANSIEGVILDERNNGLEGSIYINSLVDNYSYQINTTDGGSFSLPNPTIPIRAKITFTSKGGIQYTTDNRDGDIITLTPGQQIMLQGWKPTDQLESAESVDDLSPPTITATPPNFFTANSTGTINFSINDNYDSQSLSNVALFYRKFGEQEWKLAYISGENSSYSALIPNTDLIAGVQIEYYISVEDSNGNYSWYPENGSQNPAVINVK